MPLPQFLADLDIPEDCIDQRTSASEKGRSFVIHRRQDEVVYRVKVDGCWLDRVAGKRVDYLFWCTNSKERLSLVELKGSDFGAALEQVEDTLNRLYNSQPQLRQFAAQGGICVYVVLSKGQGVARRFNEIAKIKKEHNVIVRHKSQRLEINGVDALC